MINGLTLRDAIISGYNKISDYRQTVDDLNVFPVPDGDTGTNMSMTMGAAAKELAKLSDSATVGEVSASAASALLRGARGNSGVITSLLFRGFAKGLADKTEASASDIHAALALGVEYAYKAVMKPTEGTMLTVARVAAEYAAVACAQSNDDIFVFEAIVNGAGESLKTTPDLLPVLKKAGVVDAGGKGVLLIFEGMLSVIKNNIIYEITGQVQTEESESFASANNYDGEILFTYCTEFIVTRDPKITTDPLELRKYLETIGDSAVVVDDEEIIKVHVHTENPGNALQEGLKFGSLYTVKIENMRDQQQKMIEEANKNKLMKVDPEDGAVGFVCVAAGEGLKELFCELGSNHVVSGGQTMNPSTDDILEAVLATPAQTVFVLPNNKNIILAAEQTVSLADRTVIVLPTKTIPQGVCAMLAYDPDLTNDENFAMMSDAFSAVSTGSITFAARDSEFGGLKIKENDILALNNGKIEFTDKDPIKAVVRLSKQMFKKDHTFITLFYGEDITEEQAQAAATQIAAKVSSHAEISVVKGSQPVYHFIVSIE